jgi:hypothetical protein
MGVWTGAIPAQDKTQAPPEGHPLFPDLDENSHITVKELKAAHSAVKALPNGASALLFVDNSAILGMLNSGYSKSRSCAHILKKPCEMIERKKVRIKVRYIASTENIIADKLSRENFAEKKTRPKGTLMFPRADWLRWQKTVRQVTDVDIDDPRSSDELVFPRGSRPRFRDPVPDPGRNDGKDRP